MLIPVGPVHYMLSLEHDPIVVNGQECRAACDGHDRRIKIGHWLPARERVYEFWHEFGHAIKFELDIHDTDLIGHEPLARLIAMGMMAIDTYTLARIHLFLRHGVRANRVRLHGVPFPVTEITELSNDFRPIDDPDCHERVG